MVSFVLFVLLPEFEENIDPVEDNIRKLSTEREVLEEEWDKGWLHPRVAEAQLVVHKVLRKGEMLHITAK